MIGRSRHSTVMRRFSRVSTDTTIDIDTYILLYYLRKMVVPGRAFAKWYPLGVVVVAVLIDGIRDRDRKSFI